MFALAYRRCLTAIALALPCLPAAAQDSAWPPARVAAISGVLGGVSFNGNGNGGWAAAAVNEPVLVGDSLYTQPGGQAEVTLDASRITLAETTELQVTGLTDADFAGTLSHGEMFVAIDDLAPGESYTIATQRGTVSIAANGRYDIAAGDAATPTAVSVFAGAASVAESGGIIQLAAGQEAVLGDSYQLVQAAPDGFAQQQLAAPRVLPPGDVPAVVGEMTGGYALALFGSWDQDATYGDVWYPNVGPGWAPYREGGWQYIQPWGWTWVDSEPWGFAPFHYGRWFQRDGRWGWSPAARDDRDRPVYAPAVVSFFGGGTGASIFWVPLAPGEAYRPYYHTSEDYDRRINAYALRGAGAPDFRNPPSPAHFANRAFGTGIPQSAMGHGGNVARIFHPVEPDVINNSRPNGWEDVRPPGHAAGAPAPPFQQGFAAPNAPPLPQVFAPGQGGTVFHPNEPPHGRLPQVFRPEGQGAPVFHPQAQPRQPMPQIYGNQAPPPVFHPQQFQPPAQPPQPHFAPMQQPHFNPPPGPHPAPQPGIPYPNHPQ
jgi:hypothetical protein